MDRSQTLFSLVFLVRVWKLVAAHFEASLLLSLYNKISHIFWNCFCLAPKRRETCELVSPGCNIPTIWLPSSMAILLIFACEEWTDSDFSGENVTQFAFFSETVITIGLIFHLVVTIGITFFEKYIFSKWAKSDRFFWIFELCANFVRYVKQKPHLFSLNVGRVDEHCLFLFLFTTWVRKLWAEFETKLSSSRYPEDRPLGPGH